MDLSFRAFLARPGSTPHAQKRCSLMEKSIQQRGKFFQLDYLFAEPKIDRFSRATRRKRSQNKQKNTQKRMQLTTTTCSPILGRTRIHTFDMKDTQKKVSKKVREQQGALFIGDRGDTIHSMKYDSRIRIISSINEHKSSDAVLKTTLKNKIGDHGKERQKMSHRKIDQQCLMFTLSAQGVNYSQRVRVEERIIQKNKLSLDKSKQSIPKKDVEEENIMKIKEFRRRETKHCRPWSPLNYSGHQPVGLDDLLTLE